MAGPAASYWVSDNNERRDTVESFVRAERVRMLRLAGALCGDPALAEEVTADVIGRIWEQWDRVSASNQPAAYARRMIVNEFLSRKRRSRRIFLTPWFADYAIVGDGPAETNAERSAMAQRLALLPPRQRAAVVLRFYQDLPDEQIAEALGCAAGTVRSLISRALAAMRVDGDPPPSTETRPPTTAAAATTSARARATYLPTLIDQENI